MENPISVQTFQTSRHQKHLSVVEKTRGTARFSRARARARNRRSDADSLEYLTNIFKEFYQSWKAKRVTTDELKIMMSDEATLEY